MVEFNTEVKGAVDTEHIIDLSDRLYKLMLAIIGLVALFIIGQTMYQFKSLPQNFPREISVSGEGKAYVKPDIALVSFGVTTQAPKSQDAVNENNKKMNEIVKAVEALGVKDEDIQTSSYNLYPEYGFEPVAKDSATGVTYPGPRSSKIVGYSLNQQIQVKIRDFDKINGIMDAATTNGANMVGSLQFTVDDPEQARGEARVKAIAQAKEKAFALFNQAGLRMGELVNVYEGGAGGYAYGMGGAMAMDAKSVAPSIQPGQEEISTSVTLTYRVR